jgi:serine/threonine protein kinase
VDIWAVGCLYAEMRTGDPIFPGESDIDQLFIITQMLGEAVPMCTFQSVNVTVVLYVVPVQVRCRAVRSR